MNFGKESCLKAMKNLSTLWSTTEIITTILYLSFFQLPNEMEKQYKPQIFESGYRCLLSVFLLYTNLQILSL